MIQDLWLRLPSEHLALLGPIMENESESDKWVKSWDGCREEETDSNHGNDNGVLLSQFELLVYVNLCIFILIILSGNCRVTGEFTIIAPLAEILKEIYQVINNL